MGKEYFRFNTDEFPQNAKGIFSVSNYENVKAKIQLIDRNKGVDFGSVKSVLYRRPVPPVISNAITDASALKYAQHESYEFIRGLWYSSDAFWVSDPESIFRAEHKIVQLKKAKSIGFLLPKTLITNDPFEVTKFFENSKQDIVIKSIHSGFYESSNPGFIFTSLITREDLDDIESLSLCPSIFQERIKKKADIRCTIVGDKIFAVKITIESNYIDWRESPLENIKYIKFQLTSELEQKCIELLRQLNLNFGTIDFVQDFKGDLYFLEINPNGQWAWLEEELNLSISDEIARLLCKNE
ncbi:hypothetical protein LFX17_20390 [Leptospira sp. FAT1]|nr:hypothetical protein [Leptospira sanjuanensis]MCG6170204.1 hypothetical protein [Leptospira sanjuanensis]